MMTKAKYYSQKLINLSEKRGGGGPNKPPFSIKRDRHPQTKPFACRHRLVNHCAVRSKSPICLTSALFFSIRDRSGHVMKTKAKDDNQKLIHLCQKRGGGGHLT